MLGRPDPYLHRTGRGRQMLGVLAGIQAPTYQIMTPRPAWQWRITRWAARTAWRIVRRIVRKARGRRRILAPWLIGAAVWLAAALAHLADKGWVTVATLALGATPAVWWWLGLPAGRMRRRRRLPTTAQRWWYGSAYALAATWATVGARWGAGPPRLGWLLALVTVCWAAWCWHHRVRPEPTIDLGEVERRWAQVPGMEGTAVENIDELKAPRRTRFEVDLSETKHVVDDVVKDSVVAQVAKRFGVPRNNIVADYTRGRLEDRAAYEIVYENPLDEPVFYDESWIPTDDEIREGVVKFHNYPNGQRGRVRLWLPGAGGNNSLFTGDLRSGKSAGMETLITQAAFTGRVWPIVGDPQTGASMPAWCGAEGQAPWQEPCREGDLGPIEAQMLFLRELMYDRSARMSEFRWTDQWGDERHGLRCWDYDITGWPLVLFGIDEAWRVMQSDLAPLFKEILKMWNKVGMAGVLATQNPDLTEFGSDESLRQTFTGANKMSYRNSNTAVKAMILSPHMPSPKKIPTETPSGGHTKGMLIAESMAPESSVPVYSRSVFPQRNVYWAKLAAERIPELEPEAVRILRKYVPDGANRIESLRAERPQPERETVVVRTPAAAPTPQGTVQDRIEAYLRSVGGRARSGVIADALAIPHPQVSGALSRGADKGRFRKTDRAGVWTLAHTTPSTATEEAA